MKTLSNFKRCILALLFAGFIGGAAADDRFNTIAGIVALWDAEMGASPGWEAEFTAALNDASDAQLSDIQNASSYDAVRAILLGGNVPTIPDGVADTEALGSLTQDLVYTPVFPCRIFDTRNTPGTPVNNQVNSYVVHGGVAGQGGNPAGCTAPKGEPVGISVNLAAVPVSSSGHLRIYPFNGTLPTASFLNYFGGGNIANSGLITTCYLCGPDISVYNRNTAHSFADVMGYFYPATDHGTRYTESGVLNISSKVVGNVFVSLGNFVTFTKQAASSNVEVMLNTRARAGLFFGGATGVRFQVRIDGATANYDNEAAITASNAIDFISINAIFTSLSAGTHTVSVWARANATGGTSSGVLLDPGGWGGRIVVKETY